MCTTVPSSCWPTTFPFGRSRTITDGLCTTRYVPRSGLTLSATLLPTAMDALREPQMHQVLGDKHGRFNADEK